MTVGTLIAAVLLGLIPAVIASRKGHSFVSYWVFGALLFIVALPVALIMKPDRRGQRKCPHCAQYVVIEAKVCKHCHRDLPAVPGPGWYKDNGVERWWDGKAWTAQVR